MGADSQTHQGGLNHFIAIGRHGWTGSDKPQQGGQTPIRSRGEGQATQKQDLGGEGEQRRLHPTTSPYRSLRSILGPLKNRSSCSRLWAWS